MLDHPAIDVRDIRKTYPGGVEAVRGLGFQVGAGEVFGLLGPNGAGKSTTIGMLTTTVAPTSGSARVAGFDVATEPRAARRVSGIVFQDSAIDRALTGRRNLDIHARLWGVEQGAASRRVEELAETLDLGELLARAVATYSGGERRRLEIARALVSEPRVLFLDEPTVGLDPRIRHELLEVIGRLRDRTEMTIMLTTHYLDEAERCHRVALIHAGRLATIGTTSEVKQVFSGRPIVEVRTPQPIAAMRVLDAMPEVEKTSLFGTAVHAVLRGAGVSAGELTRLLQAAAIPVDGIDEVPPSLDDVFLDVVEKAERARGTAA